MLHTLSLACPLDGLALAPRERSLVCARGHAYDVSRHGHVNLLPVQFKPSRDPGDDLGMVAARRRVLDAGLFDPLATAVVEHVAACLDAASDGAFDGPRGAVPLVVDAGCGEGFHANRLAEGIGAGERGGSVRVLGSDISRHAVEAAARRYRTAGWAVANNKRLPVLRGAADVVVSLFGFETWAPWAVLQDAGQWVVVADAGPRHLFELREAIYGDVRLHDAPSDAAASRTGYARRDERRLRFTNAAVPSELLADVLAMTPHGYRAARSARENVLGIGGTDLTMDVTIRVYRRERDARAPE